MLKNSGLCDLFLIFTCFVVILLCDISNVNFLSIIIAVLSIVVGFFIYIRQGLLSFEFLYFVCFCLFNVSRYYLDSLGLIDVRVISFFDLTYLSVDLYKTQSYIVIMFMFSCLLVSGLRTETSKHLGVEKQYQEMPSNPQLYFLYFIYFLATIAYLLKIKILSAFVGGDYISFQSNYDSYIQTVPAVIRLFSYFQSIAFFLILFNHPFNKNFFIVHYMIYLSVVSYSLLLGGRALFFTNIILCLWSYGRLSGSAKVRTKTLVWLTGSLLVLLAIGQLVSYSRTGNDLPPLALVFLLLGYDQGVTLNVMSLSLQNQEFLNNASFIIEHIFRFVILPFAGVLNLLGVNADYKTIIEQLAIYLNDKAFSEGYGLGGSLISETFLVFGWLSPIVNFLIILLYRCISRFNPRIRGYWFVLIPLSMQYIFFSPRSYSFEFFLEVSRLSLYLAVLYAVYYSLNMKRKVMYEE